MGTKKTTVKDALKPLKDGMTVMIGGFLGVGTPESLIDGIIEAGIKDLTLIANDTSFPGKGIGKLIEHRRLKAIIVSHTGTNPETQRQIADGEILARLTPQGTLVEQIRAGGAGLGGFLTPVGIGTVVEEGKEKITVKGREYLLELPLRADVALIKAYQADSYGNLRYRATAKNFNPVMATAAEIVIAEVEEFVDEILPDLVETPALFVDYIVKGER